MTERAKRIRIEELEVAVSERGYCVSTGADVFFPRRVGERKDEKMERARRAGAFCASCVVRAECLEMAILRDDYRVNGMVQGGYLFEASQVTNLLTDEKMPKAELVEPYKSVYDDEDESDVADAG